MFRWNAFRAEKGRFPGSNSTVLVTYEVDTTPAEDRWLEECQQQGLGPQDAILSVLLGDNREVREV